MGFEVVCPEKQSKACRACLLVCTCVDALVPGQAIVGGIALVAVRALEPPS